MKRKIALLLTFVFIFTLSVPAHGISAQADKAMENAIKIAKTKFSIPQSYKFDSSISMEGAKKIYYLNWRSTDTVESTSINVRIDESGTILGYNKYSPSDYTRTKKLPKLSRQDAREKAELYIEQIEPGLLQSLKYKENYQASIMDSSYYISYYRVVNDVPFYNDMVTVNVNRETGELQDYSRQWTGNITFPDANNLMPVKDAEEAYVKNIGLRLIYKYSNTDNILRAYPVYVPVYDNNNYAIDAITGERVRLQNNYYRGYDEAAMKMDKLQVAFAAGETGVQLNPDELKAVQDAAKLMSVEEAEKIARSAEYLNIPPESKLQNYNLGTNWPSKDEYLYSLYFVKQADDNGYEEYTSVSVNAKTGIITSFYRGRTNSEEVTPKNDMETAKKAVDEFLSKYYPEFYKQLEYNKQVSENYVYLVDGKSTNYYFAYSRLVNDVPFPDNGVTINYDNISGTISSFNLNWFDITFPKVDEAIGITTASEKLLGNVGLDLEYKYEYINSSGLKAMDMQAENAKVLLVYSLKPGKPLYIDANNGSLLNSDGTTYKEQVSINYTDIKGNAAEKQIMVLAENGIYLEGTQFKPNTAITQLDFLTLLSKTLSYYGPVITAKSTTKEIDDLYAYMQREGIIKEGEKAPAGAATREDAVKFIIRALKYDKVADIKGIYNCTFKDKGSINQNLVGYVTIAAGLGVISKGTYFRPKDKITRAESAIMIYNYLQS